MPNTTHILNTVQMKLYLANLNLIITLLQHSTLKHGEWGLPPPHTQVGRKLQHIRDEYPGICSSLSPKVSFECPTLLTPRVLQERRRVVYFKKLLLYSSVPKGNGTSQNYPAQQIANSVNLM
jgi:hypothetical protein